MRPTARKTGKVPTLPPGGYIHRDYEAAQKQKRERIQRMIEDMESGEFEWAMFVVSKNSAGAELLYSNEGAAVMLADSAVAFVNTLYGNYETTATIH